ncbi:class III lanthipeptide [Solibacillus sp. FSL W7-1324]
MSKILELQKINKDSTVSPDRNLSTISVGICSSLPIWSLTSAFIC